MALLLEAGADVKAKNDVRDERGGSGGGARVIRCVCVCRCDVRWRDIRWIVDALVDGVRATISPPQLTSLTIASPFVPYHLMDCHILVWELAPVHCGTVRL